MREGHGVAQVVVAPEHHVVFRKFGIPGAAPAATGFDPSSTGVLANATISFNGVPGNFNNWEIDGTNNVDQGSGSNSLMLYPSIDSISEFRISTSNYSAEYGKSGGANVEVVTKSGTNKFHGVAFEFLRNDAFDANDWFFLAMAHWQLGQRQLRRGATLGLGGALDLGDQLKVALEVPLLEPGRVAPPIPVRQVLGFLESAGEETPTQRAVGHKPDSQLAAHRQNLVLDVARPKRVFGLQRRNRVRLDRAAQSLRRGLG